MVASALVGNGADICGAGLAYPLETSMSYYFSKILEMPFAQATRHVTDIPVPLAQAVAG